MAISSRRNTMAELKIGDHVRVLSRSGIESSLDCENKTVMPNGEKMYWNNLMYRFCEHTGTVRGFDHIEMNYNDTGRILVDGDYDEDMLDWTFCRNWLELDLSEYAD